MEDKILKIVKEPDFEGTVVRAVKPEEGTLNLRGLKFAKMPGMEGVGSLAAAASGELDTGKGVEGLTDGEGDVEAGKKQLEALKVEKRKLQKLIEQIDLDTERIRYKTEQKIGDIIKALR
jgi:hypothetical protein